MKKDRLVLDNSLTMRISRLDGPFYGIKINESAFGAGY
jgi:hypothetical protein